MKLKVLFLATRDWYHPATTGGDMTMWEQARYLASAGHQVTFVAAGYAGAARDEIVDGMMVVRLGGIHWLWLRTFLYYQTKGRGRYDVVVVEGFGGSRIPRMSPLYVREPIITEWHQVHRDLFAIQYPRILNGPLNLLEHTTAWVHRNTLVRAGTEEWREAFGKIGFKPENVFLIPVSIRDEWLSASNGDRASQPEILWLGKLRRYKCPHDAIQAMATVVQRVKGARLTIAGRRDDTKYESELRQLVGKLGLEGSVAFRFSLTEQEKRELIRASRIVVVTSAVEGFGIVVLEANACGVPVVASSGVPEGAVQDRVNGLRYRFGQIEALSNALVELLLDEALYAQLSTNAIAFARRFSWRDVGSQYETVVRRAVAGHGPVRF